MRACMYQGQKKFRVMLELILSCEHQFAVYYSHAAIGGQNKQNKKKQKRQRLANPVFLIQCINQFHKCVSA